MGSVDTNAAPSRAPFLDKSNPAAWKAFNGAALKVQEAAEAAGVGRDVVELVNLRISQINACAFCLDLHGRRALEAGVTDQKLHVLAAWRRTDLFTGLERAALAVAEAATLLPDEEELAAEVEAARAVLGDERYTALAWAAVAMNAFNRISVLSRHPVRPRG